MEELLQLKDTKSEASAISEHAGYRNWEIYDEWEYDLREEFEEEEGEEEEEEEEEEHEETLSEEFDILAEYRSQFAQQRAKELEAKAEAKKEQLRLLIGIQEKKDDEVSEDTILTPEEEEILSIESSSESSVHPCFRDIGISDSKLKLSSLYTTYPVPLDPGLILAFWTLAPLPPAYKDDGVQKFLDLVKKRGLVDVRSVGEMLLSDKIELQYYGLDSSVLKALCEALVNNTSVQTINLKDNFLPAVACRYLSELLLKNGVVQTLILSGCRIGADGASELSNGVSSSLTLTTLDVSGCNIRCEGLSYIVSAVCNNANLENLLLNDNGLDESCAEDLQQMFSWSDSLKHLELSWNSLYTAATWRTLMKGLEKSQCLTDLDLSWNGLSTDCVPYLCRLLSRSSTIERLNLSYNRFYDPDALRIARALSKNTGLQELNLSYNPFKPPGTLAVVQAVVPKKSPNSALRLLDLSNVWANKDILGELEAIKNDRPELEIKLGGIFSNYKLVGPDPRKIFLKRANYEAMRRKKKRQRKNFGHFVLSLEDNLISRNRFKELVKRFRLKLSDSLVDGIFNAFIGPRRMMDQASLKSFYLDQYPDTKPPPEKKAKKGKAKSKKKEKS